MGSIRWRIEKDKREGGRQEKCWEFVCRVMRFGETIYEFYFACSTWSISLSISGEKFDVDEGAHDLILLYQHVSLIFYCK